MTAAALQNIKLAHGMLAWREAGTGPPLVMLHGIGSGSGSWAGALAELCKTWHVMAWDAPGYGGSAPLVESAPMAAHYAAVLEDFVRRRGLGPVVLVGHSLGAIVAAAVAARHEITVSALVLVSPAQGYGHAAAEVRETKYQERLTMVDQLGIAGMAAQRSAALCAPGASASCIETVRENMALATVGGYKQAAHMLAHDDLLSHLRQVQIPMAVMCGEHDTVTPPAACRQVAVAVRAPYTSLRGVAHACYVEDPAQFNAALMKVHSALPAHV